MARRKAKEATAGYLERVACWYIERYPASEVRVRRALEKRVARSVAELGSDPERGREAIEVVIDKLVRIGLIDDAAFAASRVRSLRQRGLSARRIRATLRRQGIGSDDIDGALGDGGDAADLEAAQTFVRKRRLGRHDEPEARRKDLAKLARAGFSSGVARAALSQDQ